MEKEKAEETALELAPVRSIARLTPRQRRREARQSAYLIAYTGVCVLLIVLTSIFLRHLALWMQLTAYAVILGLNAAALASSMFGKTAFFRVCVTSLAGIALLLAFYIVLDVTGVFDKLSNMELIKNFILSTGAWGMAVFVAVQAAQVVFLPVPAMLVTLTGVALYGPTPGFLLSLAGILLGSVIAFAIGKLFGRGLVAWIVGKEDADKYRKLFNKKGRFLFILMLVFPVFPDDMLCMVAGITTMSFWYFLVVVLLARPWGIAAACYLGSGSIIPFSGWGIAAWAGIFIVLGAAFFLINKYQRRILKWAQKAFKKK